MKSLQLKDYIFLAIIGIMLIFFFAKGKSNKTIYREFENTHKLDSLQRLILVKADSIKELYVDIDSLNVYNDKLKASANKNLFEIQKIRNETHKKDSIINFYNVDELELFFSKRYDTAH